MTRLRRLTTDELDPTFAEFVRAQERTPMELTMTSVLGHRPDLAMPLSTFTRSLKHGRLPRRLVELVRLRVAYHNQCRSCMAIRYTDAIDDGLTEDLVCSLERPLEAPDLSAAEVVALRYADLFATNHLAIGDDLYAELGRHFDEGEIVELGLQVAVFVGIGRLSATWDIIEDLPSEFQAEGLEPITPWGNPATAVR